MRVLLVEDEPLWQHAVGQLVATLPGWQLVGVAVHHAEAMKHYTELKPDVVLLDWNIIGEKDGADVGRDLLALGHSTGRMVMVSGADPAMLPETPYPKVPKSRMSIDLIPLLASMSKTA